jgi:hypothetical protein
VVFWLCAILGAGVLLLLAGLRGHCIDDHPTCRQCRFDLFGAPADRAQCPECGADVTLPSATRIGQRRRIPAIIAAGVILALAALLPLAVVLYGQLAEKDLSPYMPTWWLVSDVRRHPPAETAPQFAELTKRLYAGSLSDSQVAAIVDRILGAQSDRTQAWLSAWGDFVESAHSSGRITPAHWTTYIEQLPGLEVRVRERLRLGDPLTISTSEQFRCGSNYRNYFSLTFTGGTIDGMVFDTGGGSTGSLISSGRGGGSSFTTRFIPTLEPGIYDLNFGFTLAIVQGNGRGPTIHSWTMPIHKRIEVLPEGQPILQLVTDPIVRDSIAAAIGIDSLRLDDARFATMRMRIDQPPRDVGFDVFLRSGDSEWKIGFFTCGQGRSKTAHVAGYVQAPQSPVDIILRASEAAAMQEVDFTSIWDGEIVFENVPIDRRGSR